MIAHQPLRDVLSPYSGFSSSQAAHSFSTPPGSFTYVSSFKGPDLKNARDTSITLKFHLLYEITAITTVMICNCTVGADAFVSANPWKHFTRNPASNFYRHRPFSRGRPKAVYFPRRKQIFLQLRIRHRVYPNMGFSKVTALFNLPIATSLAQSPYLS